MRRDVQITVGVNRAGHVESVDQRSFEAFAGGVGFRIEQFHQRMLFSYDDALRLPVLRFHEMAMEAKVLRALRVRDNTIRWYADVNCPDR